MSPSKAGLRHEQLPLHHVLPVFDKSSDFIALQKVNSQLIQNNREIFLPVLPFHGTYSKNAAAAFSSKVNSAAAETSSAPSLIRIKPLKPPNF